jgi:transcriptional regulator with XRE-family HTH domain
MTKTDTMARAERQSVRSLLGYQRLYLNMTREQLSKRSGVSVYTIRDYETGRRNMGRMNAKTILSLCYALGITADAVRFDMRKVN